jgi:fermentation-respiration switch protein FrsA (DUF1100 family)
MRRYYYRAFAALGAVMLLGGAMRLNGPIDELFLFFPSKYPDGEWNPPDLQFEDVWFKAADGTRLHGWYCPCDDPRATLLIAHGNGGHLAHRADFLKYLQSHLHVATFMFDYRGYGRSEGKPTVDGILKDARAARAWLADRADVKETEIVLMGESLGGAVAVHLAAESPPRGLILQSTFSSLRDVAEVHYSKLSWFVPRDKLNSVSKIPQFKGPLLQSHGTADKIIPITSGEKLFQAANNPKTFVRLDGADHNDWLTEEYLRQLDAYLTRIADKGR